MVLIARDAVLFLVAWEIMALAAWFAATVEDDKPEVRQAGWIYLVATHIGTLILIAMFALWHFRHEILRPRPRPVAARRGLRPHLRARRARFRVQGRVHAPPCLAAGSPRQRPGTCFGRDVRRHAQDGHIRDRAHVRTLRRQRSLVGRLPSCRRGADRSLRHRLRHGTAGHQASSGILEHREYRHNRHGFGSGPHRQIPPAPRPRPPRHGRRASSCLESRHIQAAHVLQLGSHHPRRGHPRQPT